MRVLERQGLDGLFEALRRRGFTLIGPTVRQRAVVYDEIRSTDDLPAGVTDEQDGGTYRIREGSGAALFAHNVGPNSWKSHLFPSTLRLWRARRNGDGELEVEEEPPDERALALIGVRSCGPRALAGGPQGGRGATDRTSHGGRSSRLGRPRYSPRARRASSAASTASTTVRGSRSVRTIR